MRVKVTDWMDDIVRHTSGQENSNIKQLDQGVPTLLRKGIEGEEENRYKNVGEVPAAQTDVGASVLSRTKYTEPNSIRAGAFHTVGFQQNEG